MFEDFEVLYDFAGEAGSLVEDKIDQPFYEALDEFVEGMRDLDASKFTTKNRIGATTTMTTYANSYTREEIEVPKKEVSLDDLLSGDNYYADQMKIQYEEWKRQNKDQDVSQKDFRAAMINSRAFEYTSIKDEQQKKEFWVNVVATVAIVGVSIFCPPAGLALGMAYGGLEMSAAVSGKDWLTGRELDTSERVMRGAFSLLDIVPGMKAFSGGTQALRSGSKLASLSDNVLKGMKNIPSKADDLIKLGKSKALTRINSLKTTAKEAVHRGIEKGIKGLDEVGKVADNFKGNLNLNSQRKLAVDGLGALPAGGTSKVANATEKMKDALRKYDLNLSSGRRGADDIIKASGSATKNLDDVKIPSVRNGEFNNWFNDLTPGQFDQLWDNPKLREKIEDRIRRPGGYHEWHLVSRTPTFKRWGISMDDIKEMRTLTKDVKFVNPVGKHGGRGSTKAHNEILKIIDSSKDYESFVKRLNEWAQKRMENGIMDLPRGLRR
ncbi:hypothetical protein [Listeria valentina]|uniref:hypothetical protein n=1 Tax=Listeria valentina TaxID=2705293 RepID=UPI001FE69541|nr:hypothetical protein [Listeria valentina]